MRKPHINKSVKDNSITEETIEINDYPKLNNFYIYKEDINEKLLKKLVTTVRNSLEYKEYIQFLKDELDMNYCSFFNNINWDYAEIDMHHVMLTLYDIIYIVSMKKLNEESNITIYDIMEEVMKLHYECKVLLIPISKTIHELVHSGDIFIPIQYAFGNFNEFYNEYKKYFTTEQKELIKEYISLSNDIIKDYKTPEILKRKFTYLSIDGVELPKKIKLKTEKTITK